MTPIFLIDIFTTGRSHRGGGGGGAGDHWEPDGRNGDVNTVLKYLVVPFLMVDFLSVVSAPAAARALARDDVPHLRVNVVRDARVLALVRVPVLGHALGVGNASLQTPLPARLGVQ